MSNQDITLYWNRNPGVFVNKKTGDTVKVFLAEGDRITGPAFTGTVREWYETLVETLIDCRNQLRTAAGKSARAINVYVDPDTRCILESTVLFKPNLDKKGPKTRVGTLVDMNVFESRKVERFEIEIELKTADATHKGKVLITEDKFED